MISNVIIDTIDIPFCKPVYVPIALIGLDRIIDGFNL